MKNKFGLLDQDLTEIEQVLAQFPWVEEAIIFGSRAKGNYKNGSDVDIALKGNGINLSTLNRISYILNEETRMPYKFDVLDLNSIKEPALIAHINRVGICFYKRKID